VTSKSETFLRSARLSLQPLTQADVPRIAEYVTANREHFAESGPVNEGSYYTEKFWSEKVVELERAERLGLSVHRLLYSLDGTEQRIAGKCAFSAIQRGPMQAAYLGYGLDKGFVGKGLMEEALRTLIPDMFGPQNLHRIMANYMPSNVRSGSLLRRLGFQEEGLAKDYLRINGRWRDHVLTSLTNDNWVPI
jgi:ribosomal-protein-alanine N-acetyltransferase